MLIMERILLGKMMNIQINSSLPIMRAICTTMMIQNKTILKQGKMMTKIMHGSAKKKKLKFYDTPSPHPNTNFNKGNQQTSRRRVFVLNKLFMKYITDIMAMGSISTNIVGRGIEISRVQINNDFNKVNVYWLAKGTESDEEIEKILSKSAGQIGHELSQLRVMGVVPKIEFIKDKYYALVAEVDAALSKADFGEDYVPTDTSQKLRSEFKLNMPLTPDLAGKISQLDKTQEEIQEDPLPIMPMNVFGLDHSRIMNKVKQAVQQSNVAWDKARSNIAFSNDPNLCPLEDNSITREFNAANLEYQERKQKFTEFLHKRQIEKSKAMRKEKHRQLHEREYVLNELRAGMEDEEDEYKREFLDDYIEEDLEKIE